MEVVEEEGCWVNIERAVVWGSAAQFTTKGMKTWRVSHRCVMRHLLMPHV